MEDQLKLHHEKLLLNLLQQFSTKKMSERSVQLAQRAFYDCLVRELDAYAMLIVGQRQELAKTAVQEAWAKIFLFADKFNPARSSVKIWAKTITYQNAMAALHSFYKDHTRNKDSSGTDNNSAHIEDGLTDSIACPLPAMEERVKAQEVQRVLMQGIDGLSSDNGFNYILAMKLVLDDDITYQEMSEVLSLQSVRSAKLNASQVSGHVSQAARQLKIGINRDLGRTVDKENAVDEDITRFRGQCFQFACHKLDPKEAIWMQDMLRRHPYLQQEVDENIALVTHARQALAEEREQDTLAPLIPFEEIRRTLLARQKTDWSEKFSVWWRQQASTPVRTSRWAFAVMLVLGIIITLQTSHFFDKDVSTTEFRAVEVSVQKAVLEVVFKKEASLDQIRTQLATLNMPIISGPDRNGLYEVEVSRGSVQAGLQALKESTLVMTAQVQDLRARDSR